MCDCICVLILLYRCACYSVYISSSFHTMIAVCLCVRYIGGVLVILFYSFVVDSPRKSFLFFSFFSLLLFVCLQHCTQNPIVSVSSSYKREPKHTASTFLTLSLSLSLQPKHSNTHTTIRYIGIKPIRN